MTIVHKYTDKSIFSEEVLALFDFFAKIYMCDNASYKCKNSEEEEMMEYFCSVGFAKKTGKGTYLLEEDCSIINSFCLFLNCLTNKLSMPYTSFCSGQEIGFPHSFGIRAAFQSGIMHGDFLLNEGVTIPFLLGVFDEKNIVGEPLFLHCGFLQEAENRDEAFAQLSDIKNGMPKGTKNNHYVVYDRINNILIFETEDGQKVFEKVCPFWKDIQKTYYYANKKSMINADIQSFMENPTEEGAQSIIESLKADFQNKFPDVDIDIKIMSLEEAKPEPLKPVEQENITKTEGDDKKEFTYLLHHENIGAAVFKNGELYCSFLKTPKEDNNHFIDKIEKFIDRMNG